MMRKILKEERRFLRTRYDMSKTTLNYGDFRRITKTEDTVAWKAKRFINTKTGEKISGAEARRRAGSTAPSRQPKTPTTHISKSQSVGKVVAEKPKDKLGQYKRNVVKYATLTGKSRGEVRKDKYFQFLNKETNRLLEKKERIEKRLKKAGKSKDEIDTATLDLRTSLGELFRQAGRKDRNDYTSLGGTPDLS